MIYDQFIEDGRIGRGGRGGLRVAVDDKVARFTGRVQVWLHGPDAGIYEIAPGSLDPKSARAIGVALIEASYVAEGRKTG